MNWLIKLLTEKTLRKLSGLIHRLVERSRASKQKLEIILCLLFYCALFGSIAGTTATICQPAMRDNWCIITITGAGYGFLLACLSIICGMAVWCCMDLFGFVRTEFWTLNCVYGIGVAFAAAVCFWAVRPLVGTAISIIALVTVFPVFAFGYWSDFRIAKRSLPRRY